MPAPDESQAARELLERTAALSEENNRFLRKLVRAARWRRIFTAIYWFGVIAAALGAYYVIQPYLEQLREGYRGLSGGVDQIERAVETVRNVLP